MQKYIGCKIIRAEKMDECSFLEKFKGQDITNSETQLGYHVKYPDGYDSWSPERVFEIAYRELTYAELDLLTDGEPEVMTLGDALDEDDVAQE